MKKIILAMMCLALLLFAGCKTPPEDTVETTDTIETTEVPVVTPDVVEDSLDVANEKLIETIYAAREKAVAAGAEQYFAGELQVVDIAASEAQSVYEDGGDDKVFNETASNILYQYMALEQASLAAKAQERIAQLGYESYDAESYAEGNRASEAALAMFTSGADGKSIYDESKKAADAYNKVLYEAFSSMASEKRASFLAVKEQADEVKAGVADKQNYANAVVFFTQGDANLVSDEPEAAYENFSIATDSMTTVYETVAEKRRMAQEAIDRAKRRLEDADQVAAAADSQVPLADVEALETINEESTEGGE